MSEQRQLDDWCRIHLKPVLHKEFFRRNISKSLNRLFLGDNKTRTILWILIPFLCSVRKHKCSEERYKVYQKTKDRLAKGVKNNRIKMYFWHNWRRLFLQVCSFVLLLYCIFVCIFLLIRSLITNYASKDKSCVQGSISPSIERNLVNFEIDNIALVDVTNYVYKLLASIFIWKNKPVTGNQLLVADVSDLSCSKILHHLLQTS